MRLDWLRADQASARRATALLAILLAVSMLATLLLAAHTLHQAGRERVVVVPPAIHKTFWVEAERASPEYLEQMGYFPAQLTLNVTPKMAVRSRVTARTAESFPLKHQWSRQSLGKTGPGRAKADLYRQDYRHFDEVQHWRGFPGDLRGMHVSRSIEVYRALRGHPSLGGVSEILCVRRFTELAVG